MRVVFMGTPDIASVCLHKIIEDGFQVVGVYTQPDRPKGRGMKMIFSPVKEVALEAGIPVLQPNRAKEEAFIEELKSLNPDYPDCHFKMEDILWLSRVLWVSQ